MGIETHQRYSAHFIVLEKPKHVFSYYYRIIIFGNQYPNYCYMYCYNMQLLILFFIFIVNLIITLHAVMA